MKLIERHVIKPSHPAYKEIDELCFKSKNLYNAVNFIVRQEYIHNNKQINYAGAYHLIKESVDYKALPAKVSCQIIKLVDRCWLSYFAAISSFTTNPDQFKGRPRLPGYKHKTKGRCVVIYPAQGISKRGLKKGLLQPSGTNISISTAIQSKVKELRLVPRSGFHVVEAVYEKNEVVTVRNQYIAAIDLGLNNLATIASNKKGFQPLIINGRPLKSTNQFFNKQKARLQSKLQTQDPNRYTSNKISNLLTKRDSKVDTYLHQASRTIINYLLQNQIDTLVIGNNKQWKQDINIGKRNNQNFVQIPHYKFIQQLVYKANLAGVKVIINEESYTSKASFLDLDNIPEYQKGAERVFSGRRVARGLYKASNGRLINADLNGAYNILRKAVLNAFADGIEGLGVTPIRFTPGKVTL